uniref:RRM domain-containing protein n=1 Tax=Panagrolaimus sp. JU765 TaxID=591449 RepID=A0AC34QPG2_9BILA
MSDDLLEPVEGEEQIHLNDEDIKNILDSPTESKETEDNNDESKHDNFEDDLYDAAIEPSGTTTLDEKPNGTDAKPETAVNATQSSSTTNIKSSSQRKYCCYVSQMTWWTTDVDLENVIKSCGVEDIIDLRFYENRTNGQSKGFALVVLASETSIKKLTDELPSKTIHNQHLAVLPYSKQNLEKLDAAAKKSDSRNRASQSESAPSNSPSTTSMGAVRIDGSNQPASSLPQNSGAGGIPGLVIRPNALAQQPVFPANQFSQPPPNMRPPPIMNPPTQNNFMSRQPNLSVPPPMRPNPGMPGFGMMSQPPPLMGNGGMMNMMPPMQNGYPPMGQQPPFGMPNFSGPPPSLVPGMDHPITEQEFEEIMHRNHAVCSSAISRAVSDAATGEYRSAIETLVTAVNLIKQSKISKHDRCKALIASLEDTVRGIENKHYSRKHRRSRSRSPERRRHRRRSRSRSRDRSPRRRY